jgi:regulator of protease activity HflC (stomatin/prohibitin superfamily)
MEFMVAIFGLLVSAFVFGLPILFILGIRIVDQYEKGLVLTFGKFTGIREPGFRWVFPVIQRIFKIDLRITTVDVQRQEVITKDNVTIGVDAVVYFRVKDAEKAVLAVQNFRSATVLYAQAAMRDVVGNVELDTLLSERDKLSEDIKKIVDAETDKWGIDVDTIKIQNIELPQDMKRAMAKQAEAERERRAVIINAEGEFAASEKLAQAAAVLTKVPGAMNIRTLETLEKIAPEPSQKSVFVLPADVFEAIKHFTKSE